MKSKESVEYSYKCKGDSVPISLNVMSTWSYLSGRKKHKVVVKKRWVPASA